MGGDRSCLWLGVLLVLPFLDARTVKIVPAETKIITTDDGATHAISRYIVIPDDETSSLSTDAITHELRHNDAENKEVKESKLLLKNTNANNGNAVNTNANIKTEDIETVKPGLVKITIKGAQGAISDKETKTVIPHESKMTIYVNENNSGGKVVQSDINGVLGVNSNNELLQAGVEEAVEGSADHDTSKHISGHNNEWVKIKHVDNPAEITNIKYTELPINWDYTRAVGSETEEHSLLKTIAFNKTFTLPGKRGRFKLIYEDDNDEYSGLEKFTDKQITLNPSHETTSYNNYQGEPVVNSIRIPDDVNENDQTSSKSIKNKNNNQHSDTTTDTEKAGLLTDAESDRLGFGPLTFKNQNRDSILNLDNTNTNPVSETGALVLVKSNSSKSSTINNVISDIKTDLDSKKDDVKLVLKSHTISSSPSNSSIENKKSDTDLSKNQKQTYYTDFSDEDESDEKSTFNHNKAINYFAKQNVAMPTLNKSNKDSIAIEKVEPKLDNTASTIHSKNITTNAKVTKVTNLSQKNHMQVLPLEISTITTDPSEVGRLKTINTTSTKTTIVTHKSHVLPTGNRMEITSSKNHSYVRLPEQDTHQHENLLRNNIPSIKTTFTSKFENVNAVKSKPTIKTTTKTSVKNKETEINSFDNQVLRQDASSNMSSVEPKRDVNNINDLRIENQYHVNAKVKLNTDPKIVLRMKKLEDFSNSSTTNKNTIKSTKVTSNHETQTVPEVNNVDSDTNIVSESKNNLRQNHMNKAEPSANVTDVDELRTKNDFEVEAIKNSEPKTISKENEGNITDFSTTNKNTIETSITHSKYEFTNELNTVGSKSQDQKNINRSKLNTNVSNVTDLGIENQYQDKKQKFDPTKVFKKENIGDMARSLGTSKKIVKTSGATSKHEITTDSEINNLYSNTNISPKTENSQINNQGQEQSYINSAEPNTGVNSINDLKIKNQYHIDKKENADAMKVLMEENLLGAIASSSATLKNIVNTDSNTNIAPETENDHRNEQVSDQKTRIEPNTDDIKEPSYQSNISPDFTQEKPTDSTLIHDLDLPKDAFPTTKINEVKGPSTPDDIEPHKHELFKQKTSPTDETNSPSPTLNDKNNVSNEKPNILLLFKEKLNPTGKNQEFNTDVEQSENISAPITLSAVEVHEISGNNIEKDQKDSVSEDIPLEGGDETDHINYKGNTPHVYLELPEIDTNKYFVNQAPHKTRHLYNQNNYHVPDTSNPDRTYGYIPGYLYRRFDSQPHRQYSLDNIDNKYLQNLRDYLIFSNILAEFNQKYEESLRNMPNSNVNRNAWIIKHLEDSEILDKLTPEQLKYLIQHITQHKPLDVQKNNNHKVEVIHDIVNLPTISHAVARQNQVILPNKYVYPIPYTNILTATIARNQKARLLEDDAYLQQYLLKDHDRNTINEAILDLGGRVLNIVNYLRSHGVSDNEIILFILKAKNHFTTEVLQTLVTEYHVKASKAYIDAGMRIDRIAKQLLHRSNLRSHVIPYNC